MKYIKIKEIEEAPLIIFILFWCLATAGEGILIVGIIGLTYVGVEWAAETVHISRDIIMIAILMIAIIRTGWIAIKHLKNKKVEEEKERRRP